MSPHLRVRNPHWLALSTLREIPESLGAVDDQHLELDGSSSVAQEFGLRYDPVCICLPGNVKNKENALKWIQSVLK